MPSEDNKVALPAPDQVEFLRKEKGCAFELVGEAEAERVLGHEGRLYRLKAYTKDFETYQDPGPRQGLCIGLDFGHLVELDALDRELRDLMLDLTLDIEESLKNRINRAAQEHGSNPYVLTEAYLAAVRESVLADQLSRFDADVARAAVENASELLGGIDFTNPYEAAKTVNQTLAVLGAVTSGRDPDYIRKSIAMMSSSTYSGAIVKRYQGRRMTYMALLELLSFGPLVGFYKQCFKKDGLIDSGEERELCRANKNMLRQAQSMRNAAAHSDATLNTLASYRNSGTLKGVRRKLREFGVDADWADRVASVPVAMEVAAVLMCHEVFVERGDEREQAAERLLAAAERFGQNADWFVKCYSVSSFIEYATRMFDLFSKRYRDA